MNTSDQERSIDYLSLFLRCYGMALLQWNMLEININNLIINICQAKDFRGISAALGRVMSVDMRISMVSDAIEHCVHDKKIEISKYWKQNIGLLDQCKKDRNKFAHYILMHTQDNRPQQIVLIDNLLKFPRKKETLNIIEIENSRLKTFALSNRLENLNNLIIDNPDKMPEVFEQIVSVSTIEEIAARHGFSKILN